MTTEELYQRVAKIEGWGWAYQSFYAIPATRQAVFISHEEAAFRLIEKYRLGVSYHDLVSQHTGWRCGQMKDENGFHAYTFIGEYHKDLITAVFKAVIEVNK